MSLEKIHSIELRVRFLQELIDCLQHYLPDTYQLLMDEMDSQQRLLMEYKIKAFYQETSYEPQN